MFAQRRQEGRAAEADSAGFARTIVSVRMFDKVIILRACGQLVSRKN
jgi:hypothetical protein